MGIFFRKSAQEFRKICLLCSQDICLYPNPESTQGYTALRPNMVQKISILRQQRQIYLHKVYLSFFPPFFSNQIFWEYQVRAKTVYR